MGTYVSFPGADPKLIDASQLGMWRCLDHASTARQFSTASLREATHGGRGPHASNKSPGGRADQSRLLLPSFARCSRRACPVTVGAAGQIGAIWSDSPAIVTGQGCPLVCHISAKCTVCAGPFASHNAVGTGTPHPRGRWRWRLTASSALTDATPRPVIAACHYGIWGTRNGAFAARQASGHSRRVAATEWCC